MTATFVALAAMAALAPSVAAQVASPPHALAKATIDRYEKRSAGAAERLFGRRSGALFARARVRDERSQSRCDVARAGRAPRTTRKRRRSAPGWPKRRRRWRRRTRRLPQAIRQQVAQSGIDALVTAFIAASSPTVTRGWNRRWRRRQREPRRAGGCLRARRGPGRRRFAASAHLQRLELERRRHDRGHAVFGQPEPDFDVRAASMFRRLAPRSADRFPPRTARGLEEARRC